MDFCGICENEEHYKDKKIRIYNSYWCELITYEINFCPLCGKHLQPDRLRRVDTGDSEAIVGSANIDEIAESSRND